MNKLTDKKEAQNSLHITNTPPPPRKHKRRAGLDGFTLAETLITLAIIGIIAAITIPNLLSKYEEHVRITKLKKIYNELSQVNDRLKAEYGGAYLEQCEAFDNDCFKDLLKPLIKVKQECKGEVPNECQATSYTRNNRTTFTVDSKGSTTKTNDERWPILLTENNYSIKIRYHGTKGTIYNGYLVMETNGWFQIDVNGLQKPNIVGEDIFFFSLIDGHLSPFILTEPQYRTEQYIKSDCKSGTGVTCAAYYLISKGK